jgi:CRISPR-associated protein Cas2
VFTIICYDIVSNKRRTSVMKLLKGYGTRVQRSVFECELDPVEFATLRRQLQAIIDRTTDSVRCYRLDAAAVERITIDGIGHVSRTPTHWVI